MKKYLFIASLLSSVGVYSQNSNSPYSIVGIGDIENNYYNRTSGLANTGFAYRNERYLINNNPAAYSDLQQQFFAIEMSGMAQFIGYSGTPVSLTSNSSKDFAIKRLAVGTKINKWWGSGVGLAPFSTSNYGFTAQKPVQGTQVTIPATYDGNGVVNKVYWINSFQPFKHFSVGVEAAYLFGSLNQTETLTTADLSTSLATTTQIYLRNFYFTYGAQYYLPVTKHWDAAIGATFNAQSHLAAENTVTVTDNTTQILSTQVISDSQFKLPNSVGVGLSLTKDKKYTWLADYKYQAWSSTNFAGAGYALTNSSRTSVGFEKSIKKQAYNTTYEKNYLQFGAYYGTSYLDINGKQLDEFGVTVGYGFISLRSPLAGHVFMELGQRGTTENDLIRERFINFGFTVSYRDLWFTKGRKFD